MPEIKRMPPTAELVAAMMADTGMTEQELTGAGLDLLHFFWTVHKAGGYLGAKIPGHGLQFKKVQIQIPGMTEPKPSENS